MQMLSSYHLRILFIAILISVTNAYNKLQISHKKQQNYDIKQSSLGLTKQIALYNNKNYAITAQISVGSQNQTFDVLLDTGSNYLWLQSLNCQDCPLRKPFKTQSSKTYIPTALSQSITYAKGYIKGSMGLEQIAIGNVNTMMILVTAQEEVDNEAMTSDGIMGLGRELGYQNWFESAYKADKIVSSMFAFELNLYDSSQPSHFYYNFTSDDFPSMKYIYTSPNATYWMIPLNSLTVNQNQYAHQSEMLIDSGSSFLLPSKPLFQQLRAQFIDNYCTEYAPGRKTLCYPPDKVDYPTLRFELNDGFEVLLEPEDYLEMAQGIVYELKIEPNIANDVLIMGLPFFYQHFVLFDDENQRIGIDKNVLVQKSIFKNVVVAFVIKWLLILLVAGGCGIYTKIKKNKRKEDFSVWIKSIACGR